MTNNLKLYRKKAGKTQQQISAFLGLSLNGYGHYESGHRRIPVEYLSKLADLYGVTTDDLLGRNADEFGRKITEQPEVVADDETMIPLVASLRCGSGYAGEPFNFIRPVPIPKSYVRKYGDGLQALIAVGESMMPKIIPGDLLICRPGNDWTDGNVVSVNYDDMDMIKRIYATQQGIDLRSDNPSYETIHVSKDDIQTGRFHVLGRVLVTIGQEL